MTCNRLLVDTNVVSYLLERSALSDRYRSLLVGCRGCIAFVTAEELYFGADKRGWSDRRRGALEAAVSEYILLLPNLEIARISAQLRAKRMRAGKPLQRPDAWIAATALWHEMPLVSHDGDFDGIDGLEVLTFRILRVEESRAEYGNVPGPILSPVLWTPAMADRM